MECLPTANPLYSVKAKGLKTEYHAAFEIEYNVDDPNLKWKVHLGDVVAFSTLENNDAKTIQEFVPKHYEKASLHWQLGLVTLLKQELSPKSQSISIQLRILEKILDTSFAKDIKKEKTFRPFIKKEKCSQLPHVLVKTKTYKTISPDQVLPLRITLISRDEFKDGVNHEEDEDNLNLKFYVPKENDGTSSILGNINPDVWVQLNPHKQNPQKASIPVALQESWKLHTKYFSQFPELLSHLVHGYKHVVLASKWEQHFQHLNQRCRELKHDEEGGTEEEISSDDPECRGTSKTKKSNKRRATSSRKGSAKKVRIQTPDEENANFTANKKISKSTAKNATTKRPSILSNRSNNTNNNTPKKRKASKKKDASTASTSGSTMSSSPKAAQSPGKKRKRKVAPEVVVDESTWLLKLNRKVYYPELQRQIDLNVFLPSVTSKRNKKSEWTIQPENNYFDVKLGQIVAIQVEKTNKSPKYDHNNITKKLMDRNRVPWSLAQVVSIFYSKDDVEWFLQVRWFFGLEEMALTIKDELLADKSFACTSPLSNSRVIEGMNVNTISVDAVLPLHVQVSSSITADKMLDLHEDGLPIVRLACRHLTHKGQILPLENDWEDYQDRLGSHPDSLQRGFESLPPSLQRKTVDWFQETYESDEASSTERTDEIESISSQSAVEGSSNDDQEEEEDESDQDDIEDSQPLEVSSLASKPLYDRWNREFHDGVRLDVDRHSLVRTFSPKTRQWTVKVGFVVPIRLSKESVPKGFKGKKNWHPFMEPWSPAQIVSIYKNKTTNEWMMQVRWFHHFQDLLPQQKVAVKNFDKPYVVFETEEYVDVSLESLFPGRVIMTSSDVDSWAVETSFLTGLPLIPRLCGYICLDEEIDTTRDWTNYDLSMKSLPQPLSRGLMLDPINRENKGWILMLSRYYKAAIASRGIDPDEQLIKKWEGVEGGALSMDFEKFDVSKVQLSATEKILFSGESTVPHFFKNLSLTIPSKNLVEPSKVEKRSKDFVVSCKLGDVVCFYDEAAAPRADYVVMKHLKHLWHPYRVPWCFGHILSIHSNAVKDELCVEIRRFLRHSDLPSAAQTFAPSASDSDREEVFESDVVVEVPASHLLGTADIFFSNFERAVKMNDPKSRVSLRCKYFFQHKAKRILPIVGSSFAPEPWFHECRSRSLQFSNWAGKYDALKKASTPVSPGLTATTVVDLLGSATKSDQKSMVQLESCADERTMYLETKIEPNWSTYHDCGPFFSSRSSLWKIKVGDFVAVHGEAAKCNIACHPFTDSWSFAQILAIFMDNYSDSINGDSLRIQVRLLKTKEVAKGCIPFVEPLEPFEALTIRSEDLRGPLLVCRYGDQFDEAWKTVQQHIPSIPCWANGSLYTSLEISLEKSTLYTPDGINEILSKIDDAKSLSTKLIGSGERLARSGIAWTSCEPFHIDLSQLRTFYAKMKVISSREMYAVGVEGEDHNDPWTVQMGDVVLIRCEGAKRYPMDCSWSVAEIVAIFKEFDSTDELEKDQHTSGDPSMSSSSLRVEIRWLYERHELQRDRTVETESPEDYDEVFESDHVDIVQGEDILCLAKLFSDSAKFCKPKSFRGMPVNQYVCRRFWSTKRKSLIPCGKLEGRQERGWLYSRNFPQEAQDKYSDMQVQGNRKGAREESGVHTWHENMNRVISKLTLLDASTGAYERGEGLVGREKQMHELLSFFRAAIRGTAGTGGVKSSLFLAGSPGVGKTACVRAALARLRNEQSTGTIPKFNLISLNGMELRHPFEAYGKFWEALTGLKHVGSHEAAAARLTRYFTSPIPKGAKQNNAVTVLLLDEIDYLMTEKQTVLYDFFDWPKRAAELRHGRRLVVVGISNTLNLADQLLQSVRSRLGSENKLLFKSYDLKETIAILDSKMNEASPKMKIFDKDAILLASKKTAGLSGDIRKVFKICRDAAKLVLRRWEESDSPHDSSNSFPTVRIGDVQKASLQSLETALKVAVSFSSPFQALLLVSVASLKRATGREGNFDIKDVMMKMEALSGASGQMQYSPPPSFARTMDLLTILAERGLLCLTTARSTMVSFRANKGGGGGAWPLVSLMIGEDQLSHGLKRTRHKALCDKNIPSLY